MLAIECICIYEYIHIFVEFCVYNFLYMENVNLYLRFNKRTCIQLQTSPFENDPERNLFVKFNFSRYM